ncbi:hypothetical protein GNI_114670 [Gregarina niphandrodes]|uniref:Uncharacterized protein n=1 Tax=Gregarina niphandrodes TaxID=110365 RepID=A0A023B363_GRENI|nr:hypothetical protein GNI_114670 [Gregarina niphandrodes]EZG55321.1 hypothetical protein GNI_114670 [Gregarina niphandrodes]|eukprot:XP_011131644.1 hypothetical protein GNI_114670 [Gregarina niphandrodes]
MQANAHLACSILRATVNDVVYKNYGQPDYNQAFTSFIPQDLLDAIGKNAELERRKFATLPEYNK